MAAPTDNPDQQDQAAEEHGAPNEWLRPAERLMIGPTFGKEAKFGTVPGPLPPATDGLPFLLHMATTTVAVRRTRNIGRYLIAIDPGLFQDRQEFAADATPFCNDLKAIKPVDPNHLVMVTSNSAMEQRGKAYAEGIRSAQVS